ncbi:MAG: Zn-ribbon domain-containing OB-fold protein [Dehalococcoidia bacterium]|nr:Zn-ribbon domain-containing OB-fold protein [Dehalococcoidia bacterium]
MAEQTEYKKPLPTLSNLSRPFWDATKQHRLTFQRCKLCGPHVFYPRDICPGPECFGVGSMEWAESSGRGWIYSYTISHQPAHPGFVPEVPYVFAIVQLEEGVRMNTNIVGIEHSDLRIGMPVEVGWDDVTPEITLPKFGRRGG